MASEYLKFFEKKYCPLLLRQIALLILNKFDSNSLNKLKIKTGNSTGWGSTNTTNPNNTGTQQWNNNSNRPPATGPGNSQDCTYFERNSSKNESFLTISSNSQRTKRTRTSPRTANNPLPLNSNRILAGDNPVTNNRPAFPPPASLTAARLTPTPIPHKVNPPHRLSSNWNN